MTVSTIEHLDHFQRRVIQDALNHGAAAYWRRRAQAFEDARPKPGDYTGHLTPEEIAEQDRRIAATAHACRVKAEALECGVVAA